MARINHMWNHPSLKNKSKNDSSVQCLRCGMIRQYVGGIATYFLNDTVYDKKAPSCNPTLEYMKERQQKEWDEKRKEFAKAKTIKEKLKVAPLL